MGLFSQKLLCSAIRDEPSFDCKKRSDRTIAVAGTWPVWIVTLSTYRDMLVPVGLLYKVAGLFLTGMTSQSTDLLDTQKQLNIATCRGSPIALSASQHPISLGPILKRINNTCPHGTVHSTRVIKKSVLD